MKKEFLQGCFDQGLSLEQIGKLCRRDPSTVSHHMRRHGLTPAGHDLHAPNARVDPDRLRELVERGATVREAAAEFEVSYTTIRHWMKRLGLETKRMTRLRQSKAAMKEGRTRVKLNCPKHGDALFFRRPDGNYRCVRCRSEAVVNWRRRVKLRLIERAGGRCVVCGYNEHPSALHFHHLDPSGKRFHLSREGTTRSFAEAVVEADKCILLCANCHAEVEAGATELPADLGAGGKVETAQAS